LGSVVLPLAAGDSNPAFPSRFVPAPEVCAPDGIVSVPLAVWLYAPPSLIPLPGFTVIAPLFASPAPVASDSVALVNVSAPADPIDEFAATDNVAPEIASVSPVTVKLLTEVLPVKLTWILFG